MNPPFTQAARDIASPTDDRLPARIWRNMAAFDWLMLGFHFLLLGRLSLAPASPRATTALYWALALISLTCANVLLCRGELIPWPRLRALVYRLFGIGSVCLSYFEMGYLLPALQQTILDAELLWLDRLLLGETPAVTLQVLLSPATSAWFGFFYYSYLWLLGLNILGSALFDRDTVRMGELLGASAMVGMVGHLGYLLVPGVGPYAFMTFAQPIPPSFWWDLVEQVVKSAGSMLDIFPSLHTAYPTMFALHALRHRQRAPFRYIWPVSVFFAVNIVISTMLLRWHYAVDVAVGLALAWGAHRWAVWYLNRTRHRQAERQPVFEDLWRQPGSSGA